VLALILARGAAWAWVLLALTAALRVSVAIVIGRVALHDPQVLRSLAIIPLRDLLALGVWVMSFAGHRILWRGDRFTLKDGKLTKLQSGIVIREEVSSKQVMR
jgi:ceramide glucosyltransferase